MKKGWVFVVFCYAFYVLFSHLLYHYTGFFSPEELSATKKGMGGEVPSQEVEAILSEPFSFLSHGHQTFAFQSQDGRFVLKLFKKRFLRRECFYKALPLGPFAFYKRRGHLKRQERLFQGYLEASQKDPLGSGLVYVHLESVPCSCVTLKDALGKTYTFPLKHVAFALQKRATPFRCVLRESLKERDCKKLKTQIEALYTFLVQGYQKGLLDQDHNVLDNLGIVDGQFIRMDLGKVARCSFSDKNALKEDLEKVFYKRVFPWIKRHDEALFQALYTSDIVLDHGGVLCNTSLQTE